MLWLLVLVVVGLVLVETYLRRNRGHPVRIQGALALCCGGSEGIGRGIAEAVSARNPRHIEPIGCHAGSLLLKELVLLSSRELKPR